MNQTVPPSAPEKDEVGPRLIQVLFADDSSAMRSLARSCLTVSKGFSVAAASDGAEALAMFDAHQPDCVVLDIDMPGVGGFEALDELQRRCPEVPVVMLSGFGDPVLTGNAKARGAAAYLQKSTEMGRLAETVRRVTRPVAAAEPAPPSADPPGRTGWAQAGTDDGTVAEMRRLEYVISHDFAEPVRIMGGFAALLDRRYASALDAPGQAFLTHLLEGAQRMQRMVDDLLVYSRAGQEIMHPEPVDVAQLAVDVMAELAPLTAQRSAKVTAGPLPSAWGDVTMLRTVLRHVVRNGLTFNTAVRPTVQIGGWVAGSSCVLTVTDNGIGVSADHTDAVFELFRRLNTREEYAGTGTGLALCRRLLALQSGTITLGSTAPGATVVTITLPAENPPTTNRPRDLAS